MAEFERAVFRVYENTIAGFNFDAVHTNTSSKIIRGIEVLFGLCAVLSFCVLVFLHVRFVGDNKWNCLPSLLALQGDGKSAGMGMNHSGSLMNEGNAPFFNFTDDYILHIDVYPLRDEIENLKAARDNSSSDVDLHKKLPDFSYATTVAVLNLKSELQKRFIVTNVTFPHHECFGEYPIFGGNIYHLVQRFDGVGTVLANNLMYTSRKDGVLVKYNGDETYWRKEDTLQTSFWKEKGFLQWMLHTASHKISIVFHACIAFFLLSSSTAILVRILLSSGVIVLYPLLVGMEYVFSRGFSVQTAYRLMTLAYPWLGVPMEILRIRRSSAVPFLVAHATQIFMYYVMYEGIQILIAMWMYGHTLPAMLDIWLYSIMMLAEYYSIVYLRSVASIRFFPRCFGGLFLMYHFYSFSNPAGFHNAALMTFTMATFGLILFTLRKMEYPAYMRGDVMIEQPRGLYNSLPYSYNGIFLPPEFTIFMPVNQRARSAYDIPSASGEEWHGRGSLSADIELGHSNSIENQQQLGVNPTETPLLYHHFNNANRFNVVNSSNEDTDQYRVASLRLPSAAPTGRRRRRRRQYRPRTDNLSPELENSSNDDECNDTEYGSDNMNNEGTDAVYFNDNDSGERGNTSFFGQRLNIFRSMRQSSTPTNYEALNSSENPRSSADIESHSS